MIANTDYVSSWKSKGLSAETITPPTTSDNSLTSEVICNGTKTRVKFYWKLFKTTKKFIHSWNKVNIYIFYELVTSSPHDNNPTLKKCLFGAVILTKNDDIDQYEYSGYGIGFDRKSTFASSGFG